MPRSENQRPSGRVPVSKAGTPGAAQVLPVSSGLPPERLQLGTTGISSDRPIPRRPAELRAEVDRRLWEIEAAACLLEAALPEAGGVARMHRARWAAARALLLELVSGEMSPPPALSPLALRWELEAETALLGALVRRHGWRVVRPGVLARDGGRSDA